MKSVADFNGIKIYKLSSQAAEHYISEIIEALDSIPKVDKHTQDDVLLEYNSKRRMHQKWNHSFIALTDSGEFAGVVIGYEREKEENNQYPENCIYLSELAVAEAFQKKGLGKFLLTTWLSENRKIGFINLSGQLRFCVQTNKEAWNAHVQKLYESVRFSKLSEKSYGNRTDTIYILEK